jgi:ATP-dependent RNA helicase DDX52/ROK1
MYPHAGSGKTAAFLLPLLQQLKEPRKGGYRAVIIVPTKGLFLLPFVGI